MRDWLIKLRKEQHFTQHQVAAGAHIDRAYYAQIESGARNPSMAVACQISSFLHFNPSLFFSEHLSDPFEIALTNSPVIIAHCDSELRYTWIFNPHPDFKMYPFLGKCDFDINENEGSRLLMELKRNVLDAKKTIRSIIPFQLSEGLIHYDVFGQPIYSSDQEIIGVATVAVKLQT